MVDRQVCERIAAGIRTSVRGLESPDADWIIERCRELNPLGTRHAGVVSNQADADFVEMVLNDATQAAKEPDAAAAEPCRRLLESFAEFEMPPADGSDEVVCQRVLYQIRDLASGDARVVAVDDPSVPPWEPWRDREWFAAHAPSGLFEFLQKWQDSTIAAYIGLDYSMMPSLTPGHKMAALGKLTYEYADEMVRLSKEQSGK